MKRTTLLCLVSAGAGMVLALIITNPAATPQVAAQEQGRPPIPRQQPPFGTPGTLSSTNAPSEGSFSRRSTPAFDEQYTPEERVNIAVYENVNRSVVNINTKGTQGTALFVFDIPSEGAGSGSVLDKRGHILTNYHVVEDAHQINVALYDGKNYEARLVGRDPVSDVAVIHIEAPPETLFPVVIGDSSGLKVGQRVFAIGNPFGLERTLTTGIISSLNRELPTRNSRTIKSVIQLDAAINPGNSGGPLLDAHSRLIGMNTAIASKTGQNTGVGFAIPANTIGRIVPQLIERGKVTRPDIGIARVYQTEIGLLIATLTPGGPAEKAGLRGFRLVRQQKRRGPFVYEQETIDRNAADLIVGVDGQKIATADEFLSVIEAKRPGEEVVLSVVRENREIQVPVRLASGE
jgi:S1-C subfamily serine protease